MSTIRFSKRDVAFSDTEKQLIGGRPSFFQRIKNGGNSTPAMVYETGPSRLRRLEKNQGDLCYVVLERFNAGILASYNKTNRMYYVLVPDAQISNVHIDDGFREHNAKNFSHPTAKLKIITLSEGEFNFEILYGEIHKVKSWLKKWY